MAIVKVIEMRGEFDCRSETGRTRDGVLENLVQWQKEIFTRDEKANIVLFTLLTRECSFWSDLRWDCSYRRRDLTQVALSSD